MLACGGGPSYLVSVARNCSVFKISFVKVLLLNLCLLLIQYSHPVLCITVSDFFPFGERVGDSSTERSDDGGSGQINLTTSFPFFGNQHDKLYVNNNGIITFYTELGSYKPANFTQKDTPPMIATYWADVDITKSNGNVWYRETRDQAMLNKATQEIRAFAAYRNVWAKWVFVSTWEEVCFYGADEEGLKKNNTFQAVLVLDSVRQQSFVILNYAKLEWTTGSNSNGNRSTGLGGNPAQAGFNAGDSKHYYEIEGARTPAVINLIQTSNVGVPGRWIFRIDSAEIQDMCPQLDSGSVSFQPAFASMLGGEAVTVTGLCFETEVSSVRGVLENRDGATEELCCVMENNSPKCYLPPVLHTGIVNISLIVDGQGKNYSGQLEIKNIADVKTDVIRESPETWVAGGKVTVSWSTDVLEGAERYRFDVLAFETKSGPPHLRSLLSKYRNNTSLKRYEIELPRNFSGASIAVIKVSAFPNNCSSLAGPSIYSDIFPVRYAEASHSKTECTNWLLEKSKKAQPDITGQCPCTLRQAIGDTAKFTQDPFCTKNSNWLPNCMYRSKFASQCIMSNYFSEENGTYVCCYDRDKGELLLAQEGNGGGTTEQYHFRQDSPDVVPYLTYMQEEIAPYLHCCEYSKNSTLCNMFLQIRKPVGCRGYKPPAAAQAAGDPHITTLDNLNYTFNGIGNFVLVRVRDREAAVQVRAVPATNNNNQPQNATVFSAVAFKASSSSSLLEIYLAAPGEEDLVSVYKDSKPFYLNSATSLLTEMIIHKNVTQNGTEEFTIVMEELGLAILVQATKDLLNIMVIAGATLKNQLEGLLGNYNGDRTDDLMSRDGILLDINAPMRDIHYTFGMSWKVSGNESFFVSASSTQQDGSSVNQDTVLSAQPSLYSPAFIDEMQDLVSPNDSEELCGDDNACKFDYSVTGKKSVALSTLKFNQRFESLQGDVRPVVRCPYVETSEIPNGSRNLTGLDVGDQVTVKCDDGFDVIGSRKLTCKSNGEWDSSTPTCVYVSPGEDLPITVVIGAAAGGFVLAVVVTVSIRVTYKKCSGRKRAKSISGSDMEQVVELPTIFPFSDIPNAVFENDLFLSSLCKLSEKGSFRIPRPTFVDPNIYLEYF